MSAFDLFPWLTSRWPAWAVYPVLISSLLCGLVFVLQGQLRSSQVPAQPPPSPTRQLD